MVDLPSLSIVLPVHNAEKTLAVKVAQLLDILPDLTTSFEILVINDGSTDHTDEVAYEIAREYPHLTLAQVHGALAYYFDHRDDILKQIKADEEFALRMEAEQKKRSS